MSRYTVTRAAPLGNRRRGRPKSEATAVPLPTPEKEAAGLLRDIDPLNAAQVEATVTLIQVTERQRRILYAMTKGDPAGRRLVNLMLLFRERVLDRFVEGVQAARLAADHDATTPRS